jgi:hypothetical protein
MVVALVVRFWEFSIPVPDRNSTTKITKKNTKGTKICVFVYFFVIFVVELTPKVAKSMLLLVVFLRYFVCLFNYVSSAFLPQRIEQ